MNAYTVNIVLNNEEYLTYISSGIALNYSAYTNPTMAKTSTIPM